MTFSRAALALFLCGCARAPVSVTVPAALPRAVQAVVVPEPEEDFGCSVYAKDGVSENAETFRVCLEREVAAAAPCDDGASPDLPALELAVALIDGAGGPSDVPRAKKLLEKCFVDVAVEKVLAHADEKKRNPRAPAFEGCDAFAETTFAATECIGEHIQNERAWLRRERHAYDERTRLLFDAASKAAAEWQAKLGGIDYARYGTGTMRGAAMETRILGAMKTRRERLADLRAWKAAPVTTEARTAAHDRLVRAKNAIADDDSEPEVPKAVDAEELAWIIYRDAEIALYEAVHPGAHDAAAFVVATEHADALTDLTSDE